jgi:hypothetical protein
MATKKNAAKGKAAKATTKAKATADKKAKAPAKASKAKAAAKNTKTAAKARKGKKAAVEDEEEDDEELEDEELEAETDDEEEEESDDDTETEEEEESDEEEEESDEEEEEEEDEKEVLEVDRDKAKALFVQLGTVTAKKWDDAKLLGKLAKLDDDDDSADPGKHKKLFNQIVKANQTGVELAIAGSDDEEEEEDEKPAKAQKGKASKAAPAKKGKKKAAGVGRGPGIISEIVAILKAATKTKPVTKEGILKRLVKKFPDRSEESMKGTVGVQVPGRIMREHNIKVLKNDDGYWAK